MSARVNGYEPTLSETRQTLLNVHWAYLAAQVVAYAVSIQAGLARACIPHPRHFPGTIQTRVFIRHEKIGFQKGC